MFSISRQGNVPSVLRELRDVPERVIPYATATALTRAAQAAQKKVIAAMPQVFDSPTQYTLNSTFIAPATVKNLLARVAVKDIAGKGGTLPESYLLPEVLGGGRKEKRFERALRYAGVLAPGQRAIAGRDAPKDAYGNLARAEIAGALGARKRMAKGTTYFVAGRVGVFKRVGRTVTPILIFTSSAPQYRQRLDFEAIAEQATQDTFPAEFDKAVASIMSRGAR